MAARCFGSVGARRVQCSRRALVVHERVSISATRRQIVISEGRYPGGSVLATVQYRSQVDAVVALALARRLARRAVHIHTDQLLVDARVWWDCLRAILANSDSDSVP